MKVDLINGRDLLIAPETDFEETWLLGVNIETIKIFHKTGLTAADYRGIKLHVPAYEQYSGDESSDG